jgi:long-chain acyl-CoA synthetase
MKGYFENEEETKKVLSKDGWLYTGDIATMSEDGFVKIIDREKDMINISGFNVYPNEIENILNMHEGIFESSVVGVKFNEFRDDIKAFIVKKR